MEDYFFHLLVMIGIYLILAYSTNLVLGFGGLLPFCQGALYGVGAYAYTLLRIGNSSPSVAGALLVSATVSFPIGLLGAALAAGLAAVVIGYLSLRFRGDFFIFATLGFQMIVFAALYNWNQLGHGSFGISGIPRPSVLGWMIHEPSQYALLTWCVAAAISGALFVLYRSPYGLSLKALREDERAAESLGIPALRQHLSAFVIAGTCAGIAGALFASYVTYIDPTSFSLSESIFLVTFMLLGGTGNIRGPLAGVLVMVLLPEALRFAGLPSTAAPNVREILYGAILIALMFWRSQGLAGEYRL